MDNMNSAPRTGQIDDRHGRHMLKMLACCLIPLILVAVLYLTGFSGDYLFYVILLLCPLMHFFMMRDHKHCEADNGKD